MGDHIRNFKENSRSYHPTLNINRRKEINGHKKLYVFTLRL